MDDDFCKECDKSELPSCYAVGFSVQVNIASFYVKSVIFNASEIQSVDCVITFYVGIAISFDSQVCA
jgi:hypothetical protein